MDERHAHDPTFRTIRGRMRRFLLPWSVWFVFYALFNAITHRPILPWQDGILGAVLAGPSIHLWYMPFMFLFLIVFDAVRRHVPGSIVFAGSAVLAMGFLALTPEWREPSMRAGAPVAQYAQALSGALIGSFLAGYTRLPRWSVLALLAGLVAAESLALRYDGVGEPYLIGTAVGVVLASQVLRRRLTANFEPLARCTLGIYFLHPLAIAVFDHFHVSPDLLVPIFAFTVCALAVALGRAAAPRLASLWS